MAVRVWEGDAPAVVQVDTITPANPSTGDVFTCTINGKSITYTVTAADMLSGSGDNASAVAAVVDGLVEAWNASEIVEFTEITASDSTTHITLTADTAGRPFTVTATSTNDGGATDEVQTLTITGTPTGGTFTLTYDGQTTGAIAYNADAPTMDAALKALSNIGAGDVTCGGGDLPGTPVTITFTGALAETNVKKMTAASSLTGGTSPAISIVATTQGLAGADSNTQATTTAASGPNHWNATANWSGAAVPVNGDDVYLSQSDVPILYGLAQSAVTLDSLVIDQSYTGTVGLPRYNTDGDSYLEYRASYLAIGATAITIGKGEGAGSGRLKIDTGSVQTAINVYNSGSPEEQGIESILWKGTHAANVVNVNKGSFAAAGLPGEVATIVTTRVGYVTNASGDANVRLGDGCTLTTVNQAGGVLYAASPITTHDQTGGELIYSDKQDGTTSAMTTLNLDEGDVRYRATGTLTTANVGSRANLDFRQDMRPRTVSNMNLHERGELHDPFKTVTFTNGIDLVRCAPSEVVLDVGTHQTLTPSAI